MADSLFSTAEASQLLAIASRTVRQHAQAHNIGRRIGRDWIFDPRDIELIRDRIGRRGRPRLSDAG